MILLTLILAAVPQNLPAADPAYPSRGILVKFRPGVRTAKVTAAHMIASGEERHYFRRSGIRLIQPTPGKALDESLNSYRNNPDVLFAIPNRIVSKAAFTPDDPYFPLQWALYNNGQTTRGFYGTYTGTPGADINVRTAWETTTGSSAIIVAALDTGVDLFHPDLSTNIWSNSGETSCSDGIDNDGNGYVDDCRGWNFAGGNSNVLDDDFDYHGTHVAGIIAAQGNNGIGSSGVAPAARIMPLKILDSSGYGDMAGIVGAVEYAISKGANIINASYTYPQFCEATDADPAELEVLKAAEAAGILVVAAAGNFACNNDQLPFYPASHRLPNILSVGASTPLDSYAIFSNRGKNTVHLAAPGVNILSTILSSATGGYSGLSGYEIISGTSMAAPVVTGIAALVKAAHPQYGYLQTREAILLGVDPKGFPTSSGGRANAAKAVALDPATSPPYQPSSLSLLSGPDGSIAISWLDNSSREDGFRIERKLDSGAFLSIATLPPETTAYRDGALPQGEHLGTYRVIAFNSFGESPASAELSLLTSLAAPSGLTAVQSSSTDISLSWTNNSAALDGFKIERRADNSQEFFQIDSTDPTTTQYTDKGLPPGTYTYRVRAYVTNSTMSVYSNEVTVALEGSGGNGGGGCFIATAAYGSYLHPKVRILREFRDRWLLTNGPGRLFVDLYYRCSPPLANCIARHEWLRSSARLLLAPLFIFIEFPAVAALLLLLAVGMLLTGNPTLSCAARRALLRSWFDSPRNDRL